MGIDIRLENECGEPLACLISPSWLTSWLLSCSDVSHTVCLRFIDPYGDTLFNHLQVKILAEELSALAATISDELVDRAYEEWLNRMNLHGPVIEDHARQYPRPTASAIQQHATAIAGLALEGLGKVHTYIRFIGD